VEQGPDPKGSCRIPAGSRLLHAEMSIGLVDLKDLRSGTSILHDGPHCFVVDGRGLARVTVEVLRGDTAVDLVVQRTVVVRDEKDAFENTAHFV
jgi:hypothetical protein